MKPGDVVIDCGAAPGSWSQVAVEAVNANEEGIAGCFVTWQDVSALCIAIFSPLIYALTINLIA